MSIKPSVVPPNTPITVRKVSRFDLTKRFHREVGLEPFVAYELDIIDGQRCRREGFLINLLLNTGSELCCDYRQSLVILRG